MVKNFNLKNFDWLILGFFAFFSFISLITLASLDSFYFSRQIVWYVLGFVIIFVGSQINWGMLITQKWFRYGFYWLSVVLLLVPLFQGKTIGGAQRWIVLGDFQFGPSEAAKIALIFLLASFFSRRYIAAWQIKNILISMFYTALPAVIILMQPDLGSAVVICGIWLGFLFLGGINKKRFFIGLCLFVLLFAIAWLFVFHPYQKQRVMSFLSPEKDLLGMNYNINQSKIAIGSAGFWGKGFKMGTQSQLGFLPEVHTDFIFAGFVEEWGIFGGVILLLTYALFLFRIITIGLRVRRNDLKFLVFGASLVFFMHFTMNIGSTLGLIPVVGISLPMISYGGSNLLTSSILISIIERIKIESAY